MFAGLGMYCIGGIVIGLILAIPIALLVVRQRGQDERLKQEARVRLREYEAGEREAYRLPLTEAQE